MTDPYLEIETTGNIVSNVTLDGKPIDDRLTGIKYHHNAGGHPLVLLEFYAIPSKIRANLKFADVEIKASDKFVSALHEELHEWIMEYYTVELHEENNVGTFEDYLKRNCKFCGEDPK